MSERIQITFSQVKMYLNISKSVYKIQSKHMLSTCFLCKFNLKNKPIKGLFTSSIMSDSIKNSQIQLSSDIIKNIQLTNNRFICINKVLDYLFVEIFDEDNFENFLEINSDISLKENDQIMIVSYLGGSNETSFDVGNILKINKKIYYNIGTGPGASGSPLILLNGNFNIIGLHQSKKRNSPQGLGIYINSILNDLESQYNKFLKKDNNNETEKYIIEKTKKEVFELIEEIKKFQDSSFKNDLIHQLNEEIKNIDYSIEFIKKIDELKDIAKKWINDMKDEKINELELNYKNVSREKKEIEKNYMKMINNYKNNKKK